MTSEKNKNDNLVTGDSQEIQLSELLETIISSWQLIVGVVVATLFFGILYVTIVTPVYQVDVLMQVEQKAKGVGALAELSEIMQYVLYEVKEPKISLMKSINYLYSYLESEKLRYGERVKSDISIEGNIDDVEIPPLLFLPFLENCFKHGTKHHEDINVSIDFVVKDNFLFFTVENNFIKSHKETSQHGIGIENVERRLQLLYGSSYNLKTSSKGELYTVNLKLPLNED